MTTVALPQLKEQTAAAGGSRLSWAVQDTLTVTWRNLKALMRTQEQVFFAAVQPIMFTLLFVYVFGGAIHTSVPYVDYLIPGIYVQTVAFGAVTTAVGLSEDLSKGLIERFRALPMARSAVLGGPHDGGPRPQRLRGAPHHRGRFRRGLPHLDQLRPLPLGRADRVALQLHALLGFRHGRASRRPMPRRRRPWCSPFSSPSSSPRPRSCR